MAACLPSRAAHHWMIETPTPGIDQILATCKYCHRFAVYDKFATENAIMKDSRRSASRNKGRKNDS